MPSLLAGSEACDHQDLNSSCRAGWLSGCCLCQRLLTEEVNNCAPHYSRVLAPVTASWLLRPVSNVNSWRWRLHPGFPLHQVPALPPQMLPFKQKKFRVGLIESKTKGGRAQWIGNKLAVLLWMCAKAINEIVRDIASTSRLHISL